jgi:hypothetical protein
MQSSSRNFASGKYREEQSSRSARPRLSRDAVDRAWENGATRTYADYRPRQNSSTPPAQRQGRPAPAPERSRQPQNRRPYEQSQAPYSTPRYGGNQPRRQPDDRPRPSHQPGYRAPGGQPGLNSERWTRTSSPQQSGGYTERYEENRPPHFRQNNPAYHDASRAPRSPQQAPNTYRDSQRSSRFQHDGGPASSYRGPDRTPRFQQGSGSDTYRGSDRPMRFQQEGASDYRRPQHQRPFERAERGREHFARGQRGPAPARRDSYNPRWQSRPGSQREYAAQQHDYTERPGRAQFEGDYERFNERPATFESPTRPERPEASYIRPVTRLPDGRVLKGSRPAQRKQARFWNDVEDQTSALLANVASPAAAESLPQDQPAARKPAARPKKPGQSRARKMKTVKTARAESPRPQSEKVARKNAHKPPKPVIRPSQRGYKWPDAGE